MQFYDAKATVVTMLGMRKLQPVILIVIIISQWASINPVFQGTLFQIQNASAQNQYMESSCVTYDSTENTIRISCGFVDLTGIIIS